MQLCVWVSSSLGFTAVDGENGTFFVRRRVASLSQHWLGEEGLHSWFFFAFFFNVVMPISPLDERQKVPTGLRDRINAADASLRTKDRNGIKQRRVMKSPTQSSPNILQTVTKNVLGKSIDLSQKLFLGTLQIRWRNPQPICFEPY